MTDASIQINSEPTGCLSTTKQFFNLVWVPAWGIYSKSKHEGKICDAYSQEAEHDIQKDIEEK